MRGVKKKLTVSREFEYKGLKKKLWKSMKTDKYQLNVRLAINIDIGAFKAKSCLFEIAQRKMEAYHKLEEKIK